MAPRAPNLTEKNAALVLAWMEARGEPIPHDHQQALTAHQICSLVEFNHYPVRRADGGTNHPSNLQPLLRAAHKERTRKVDIPEIAKRKRIVRASDAAVNRLLSKFARVTSEIERDRSRWPSRKIQSRPFRKAAR